MSGAKRYSADLVQGGLEIPCKLVFTGDNKDVAKVQKFLKSAPSSVSKAKDECSEPPRKRVKQEPVHTGTLKSQAPTKIDLEDEHTIWLQLADQQRMRKSYS